MCDRNGGAAFGSSIKSSLNDFFGFGVEGARGFVEEEDLGVAKECTCDGDLGVPVS